VFNLLKMLGGNGTVAFPGRRIGNERWRSSGHQNGDWAFVTRRVPFRTAFR